MLGGSMNRLIIAAGLLLVVLAATLSATAATQMSPVVETGPARLPERRDLDLNLVDYLWDTSAGITAFAVAQDFAFFYALQQKSTMAAIASRWRVVGVALLLLHAFYAAVVNWCFSQTQLIVPKKAGFALWTSESSIHEYFSLLAIFGAQSFLIAFSAFLSICALYLHVKSHIAEQRAERSAQFKARRSARRR